jgi:hypothetical protein
MTNNKKKQQFDFEVEVGGKNVGLRLRFCVFFSLSRCFGFPN